MAHYLITGHTGFKGSWLTLLLRARGHEVSGLSLNPPRESLFVKASLQDELLHDLRVDVRDRDATVSAVRKVSPDFVIHMAAQALVRDGYRHPLETYDTNVNGTLNILHAVDSSDSVKAQLIVTTDKVYEDRGLNRPYNESDPLGGKDPYSASKAMADVLSQQWLGREDSTPGAIARAGNVIGAGDYSKDRLIPDVIRVVQNRSQIKIRYPDAVRPWQHVLDCLDGYLLLLEAVEERNVRGPWNFGPANEDFRPVRQLVEAVEGELGFALDKLISTGEKLEEARFLALDSSKAFHELGWRPKFSFHEAVSMSILETGSSNWKELGETVRAQVSERTEPDTHSGTPASTV